MPKTDATYAVVTGNTFFVDMLRYDQCVPFEEEDSNEIVSSLEPDNRDFVVVVKSHNDFIHPRFLTSRWESRGNHVVFQSRHKHEARERAQELRKERQL